MRRIANAFEIDADSRHLLVNLIHDEMKRMEGPDGTSHLSIKERRKYNQLMDIYKSL